MVGIYLNHDLSCEERRNLIFDGHILLYTCRDATAALADHAIKLATEALAPYEPQRAQFDLPVETFIERVGPLKSRFTNDLRSKELVRDILVAFGYDLEDTYFDVPRLRVVPHGGYLSSGVSYAYKPHRDTWYSNPPAQLTWWMPAFPVTPDRAMAFFPEYWDKPVRNSSAEFDYEEWCKFGRQAATNQVKGDSRNHPLPLEAIDERSEFRIAGTKGDVILFCTSHLHSTAPNKSGLTRFSVDFRTLSLDDVKNNRGGPNIDSLATGSTLRDFIRASDFKPIEI